MFKFHGIVKEADVYMSRMKRKKFLRKSENVLILSRRKEKHVQRMNALSKKKYKMNYFPDEHDPKAKTYIIRVPGTPEEDRKRIAKYMKAALNKEAEDKASKKEQRKKD
jgi:hypothetical protein